MNKLEKISLSFLVVTAIIAAVVLVVSLLIMLINAGNLAVFGAILYVIAWFSIYVTWFKGE